MRKWNPVRFFENLISLLGTLIILLFVASYIEIIDFNLDAGHEISKWNYFNVFNLIERGETNG
jgi:hypothetical protein